ncbi:MAG TPA: hypothetical protein DDZ89_08765, partial [Clostridiales bacterium]|nr:hypothetical protein [Clostridiales bacterium]
MIFILLMTGCGGSKDKEEQEENPAPRELQSIEDNIESILASLSDPSLSEEDREENKSENKQESKSENDQSDKKGEKGDKSKSSKNGGEDKKSGQGEQDNMNEGQKKESDKQSEGSDSSEGDSKKSDKESSEGGKQENPKESEQKQIKKNWKEIDKTIKEIHSIWNSYLPKAVKDGVPSDLTDEFSDTLNDLTRLSIEKNNAQLLLSLNELYSFIPNALGRYDTPVHPGIKKARYYARSVIYNANIGDWVKATEDVEKLESVWSSTMNVVGKKNKEDVEKLNYAIKDLIKVTEMQSKQLVFIKGEITMHNIKDIEKTLEDQAKEKKANQNKSKMQL